MTFTLRRTGIGGISDKDDYCVWKDGMEVGRIRLAPERGWNGHENWLWNINVPLPIPPWCGGNAASLDEAKSAFKEAWLRFRPAMTNSDVDHWHHHQEASETGRPWHKDKHDAV